MNTGRDGKGRKKEKQEQVNAWETLNLAGGLCKTIDFPYVQGSPSHYSCSACFDLNLNKSQCFSDAAKFSQSRSAR